MNVWSTYSCVSCNSPTNTRKSKQIRWCFWPGLGLPSKGLSYRANNQLLPNHFRKRTVKVRSTALPLHCKNRPVKITIYLGLDKLLPNHLRKRTSKRAKYRFATIRYKNRSVKITIYLGLDNIIKLKFRQILIDYNINVLNCLTKNFEPW